MTAERPGGRTAALVTVVVLSAVGPSGRLAAQDTSRVSQPAALLVNPDTTHLVRPMTAFFRSLLIPGWGQASTGRHTTGAVFVAWEGVTAMMTLRAQQEANYLKATGSSNVRAKRQQVQDWLVLWVFNHLFAGGEAYVSAHLQDFPRDLQVRAVPRGIGISMPLPPLRSSGRP
jgi:hypothetical protein